MCRVVWRAFLGPVNFNLRGLGIVRARDILEIDIITIIDHPFIHFVGVSFSLCGPSPFISFMHLLAHDMNILYRMSFIQADVYHSMLVSFESKGRQPHHTALHTSSQDNDNNDHPSTATFTVWRGEFVP